MDIDQLYDKLQTCDINDIDFDWRDACLALLEIIRTLQSDNKRLMDAHPRLSVLPGPPPVPPVVR